MRKPKNVIKLPWKELEKMLQTAAVIDRDQKIEELTLIKPRQIKIQFAWPLETRKKEG